jgi:SAM-dependent methyltransferase
MVAGDGTDTEAGQAVYSPLVLGVYDAFVLGFSNRFLWRCPSAKLLELYDRNVRAHHLDIGVGTGYFLDRASWPAGQQPRVTLVDLNANSLHAASARIARLSPRCVQADALKPLPLEGSFSSVGLNYLLHCLPGSIPDKAVIFDNIKPILAPDARVFGATIVTDGPRTFAAERLLALYNAKGIMSNRTDTLADLAAALKARFGTVKVWREGTVALFVAAV